jgi:valyl-tRNA synthetase
MPSGEYDPERVESEWQDRWVEAGTYAYEGATDPDTVFSIDSPPPTVSGSLHWGHVYGFTLQDFLARYSRMAGDEVFFPFGYDDNGIASERLTEDELGVRHQEYDRREFQALCREVCAEYEAEFTEKMQSLGISIDWDQTYRTIAPEVRRISQLSFLDLYEKGREYRERAPAIWCPECETAISQVETEDAEHEAHFNDVRFEVAGADDSFVISTTRPELLPACVAVFVHPEDEASERLAGERAEVPLFGHEVPILADERVDRETGTGVVMCCTFGDQTDIEWYRAHDLDLRIAIDESGTMTDVAGEYEGLSGEAAAEAIVADLDAAGHLLDRRPISHTVNVHERCGTGIEFLVTEQWYVELLDKREEYLEAGRQMDWYPEKMFTRYRNWIEGLQWDWSISRQRSSGIPFPVWYCADCDAEVLATREQLPVDPLDDEPPVEACPDCGATELVPEDDVFDTWATSSLTPLINAGWDWDDAADAFALDEPALYPMDVRPQGHDIISFWLFHTVVKCYEHTGEVPFDSVMINGMVLDENREKMSKSKGNVVDPDAVLEEFPVDAARYWAAGSSVGDDLPYKKTGLRAGERLLRKLWNASKLVDGLTPDEPLDRPDLEALDRWLLAEMDEAVEEITAHFEARAFSKARNRLRTFFWHTFCDDYLEVAKQRLRAGDGPPEAVDPAAAYTLRTAHERFLRLFAPILAHVTEELWTEMYAAEAAVDSVHRTDWPEPLGVGADREAGATAMAVVGALRRYKSDRGLALNAPLAEVRVHGDLAGFESDVRRVMHVDRLETTEAEAAVESVVTGVDLDYSTVGPRYGERVSEIDAAIAAGEFEVVDDRLAVAGVEIEPAAFELEAERRYTGAGEMIEADGAVVIVRDD